MIESTPGKESGGKIPEEEASDFLKAVQGSHTHGEMWILKRKARRRMRSMAFNPEGPETP